MIYTTGYYGHQPEALKALADALDATVVDIRFMPASRVPGWRKQALQKLLGDRYLWVQAFGNIHYNDGQPIQIADMAAGVKALIKQGRRNYILLCGCRDAHTCHRSVVGEHLRGVSREGVREVTEAEWWAATPPTARALSIQQPWAWLIVQGYKDIENRDWKTHYRGPFYVHAGKRFDKVGYEAVRHDFPQVLLPEIHEFERGGIVGAVTLVDCVVARASRWFVGPYGFVLADAKPLPFVPLPGQLGFFAVPEMEKVSK